MHVAFHALPTDCQLCATNYNMILDKDLLMYCRIRRHSHQTFHNTVEPHKCHIGLTSSCGGTTVDKGWTMAEQLFAGLLDS